MMHLQYHGDQKGLLLTISLRDNKHDSYMMTDYRAIQKRTHDHIKLSLMLQGYRDLAKRAY